GPDGGAPDGTSTGAMPATITMPTTNDGDESPGESSGDGGDTGTTGAPDLCAEPPFFKQVVLASDAVVGGVMALRPLPELPGMQCAASEFEDDDAQGTVAFPWSPPCDGVYHLWAHVWDDVEGPAGSNDPDRFAVRIDEGDEVMWHYGCQTVVDFLDPEPAWHWLRVQDAVLCLEPEPMTYTTTADNHAFVFRNIEAGLWDEADPPGRIAAISRILVTNDPTYVPGGAD
ncbi:MAG: hypothetical protein AAF721_33855, partial [Myxococcota bacterium]